MVNRRILAPKTGRRRSTKTLQRAAVVLLATTALGRGSAQPFDGTWIGSGDEWTKPTNWSSNPSVPGGTATFTVNLPIAVQSNGLVTIGSVQFTSGPRHKPMITTNGLFLVNGAGAFKQLDQYADDQSDRHHDLPAPRPSPTTALSNP